MLPKKPEATGSNLNLGCILCFASWYESNRNKPCINGRDSVQEWADLYTGVAERIKHCNHFTKTIAPTENNGGPANEDSGNEDFSLDSIFPTGMAEIEDISPPESLCLNNNPQSTHAIATPAPGIHSNPATYSSAPAVSNTHYIPSSTDNQQPSTSKQARMAIFPPQYPKLNNPYMAIAAAGALRQGQLVPQGY